MSQITHAMPGSQAEKDLERDMAAKAPPTAAKVVAIDFDNTLFAWGPLFGLGEPFEGAAVAMQALRRAGFRIVIFTSRASKAWWTGEHGRFGFDTAEDFGQANLLYVKEVLDKYDMPFDLITADKMPAEVYFDDKAVFVPPGYIGPIIDNWLTERIGS